jgi:hypothetical protein
MSSRRVDQQAWWESLIVDPTISYITVVVHHGYSDERAIIVLMILMMKHETHAMTMTVELADVMAATWYFCV